MNKDIICPLWHCLILKAMLLIIVFVGIESICNAQSTYEHESFEFEKSDTYINKMMLSDSDFLIHSSTKLEFHKANRTKNRYSKFNSKFERTSSSEKDKTKYHFYEPFQFQNDDFIISIVKIKKVREIRLRKLNGDFSTTEIFKHSLEKGQNVLSADISYSPDSSYLMITMSIFKGPIYKNEKFLFLTVNSNLEVKMKPMIDIEESANCKALRINNCRINNSGVSFLFLNTKRKPKQLKDFDYEHSGDDAYRHELWIVDKTLKQIIPVTEFSSFNYSASMYLMQDENIGIAYVNQFKDDDSGNYRAVLQWRYYSSEGQKLNQKSIEIDPAYLKDIIPGKKIKRVEIMPSLNFILDDDNFYFYLKSTMDYSYSNPGTTHAGSGTYNYGFLLISAAQENISITKAIPSFSVTGWPNMTDPNFVKYQDQLLFCYADRSKNSDYTFSNSEAFYKGAKMKNNYSLNILNLSDPDQNRIIVKEANGFVICLGNIIVDKYLYFLTIDGKISLKYKINKVLLN